MRGIIGYGTYVPHYRLDRSKITAAMGAGGGRGHRAVAGYDEDTTTMGVAAARNALRGSTVTPSSIWFATAHPAYLDKTNATAIQAALDLPQDTWAVDAGGSARSAEAAIMGAKGTPGVSMAVASDLRTGNPTSNDESAGGDGAAAVIFGDDEDAPVLAHTLGFAASTREFLDRYRLPGDDSSRIREERFGEQAYLALAEDAIERATKSANVGMEDVD